MPDTMKFVGLDVHSKRSRAAVLDVRSGELYGRRLVSEREQLLDFLVGVGSDTRAVYEAGPVGFSLARAAAARGLDVRVCAPGLIPRKPGDRVKTDARDAERLARLLAAGELSFVRVPSVEEEQVRDLVRAREDLRCDLMRARQRLTRFLMRRELRFAGPGTSWGARHMRWLTRQVRFSDPASAAAFADYLAAVEALDQRRGALEHALEQIAPGSPWAETIERLRCFRGISTLTAIGLCAEVGDFTRFPKPKQLCGYLGIVPSERTSDTRRRQGAITKAGPLHARRLLIEAAWHAHRHPRLGDVLKRRQRDQDPRVCAIAWRCQERLHSQWHKLSARRTPRGVAVVACARELATFVWEAATLS